MYPIDQEVKGMQTIKLSIPIEIPIDYKESPDFIVDIPLAFFGPKNSMFG